MLRGVRSGENAIQSNVLATDIRSTNQSQEHCSFPRSPDLTLHSVCEWDLAHQTKSRAGGIHSLERSEFFSSLPQGPKGSWGLLPAVHPMVLSPMSLRLGSNWHCSQGDVPTGTSMGIFMVWTHHHIQVRQHSSCPSSLIQLGKDPYLSAASSSFPF